jgi:hypothetical protein
LNSEFQATAPKTPRQPAPDEAPERDGFSANARLVFAAISLSVAIAESSADISSRDVTDHRLDLGETFRGCRRVHHGEAVEGHC